MTNFAHQAGTEWTWRYLPVSHWSWISFRRPAIRLPNQGWKLHLSSSPPASLELVERVLPILRQFDVAFKLPATLSGVIAVNSGAAGRTQVGKIVTVYPASDDTLREVIECLDDVWRPADAPAVPSDLPVGTGAGLWVRYGTFERTKVMADSLGRLWPAIEGPDGVNRLDRREFEFGQDRWFPDPPLPTRAPPAKTDPGAVIVADGTRYLPLKRLSDHAGGSVVLAIRIPDMALVIIRNAIPGVGCDEFGNDAVSRLRNERRVLQALMASPGHPTVVAYDDRENLLITEDIGGQTLEALPVPEGLTALGRATRTVAALHRDGLVHRDIKPPNVIFDGKDAHLVDFELAAYTGDETPIVGGSPGYHPPGSEYATAHPSQDVYSLGACLTYVLLRSCPGRLPRTGNAGRQIALLRLKRQHTGADLVAALTHPNPALRPSAEQAGDLLAESLNDLLAEWRANSCSGQSNVNERWGRTAPISAGTAARTFAFPAQRGHYWRNVHHFSGLTCQGINLGAAGIIIALSSIDEALGTAYFAADVTGAAEWLSAEPEYQRAHGLFTGNAGVAVALAVAGRRHGRPDFIEAARRRFTAAASHDGADFDLFSGAAGIVWSGCLLAEILRESWPLDLAHPHIGRIRRNAMITKGTIAWPASPDFDASGTVYFGAAHGASGIALALASWGTVAASPESVTLAAEVFSGIRSAATSSDEANILSADSGREHSPQSWCHGLNGFTWCLEQAFGELNDLPEVRKWSRDTILRVPPVMHNPTLCHGTAGTLEVFRMMSADAEVAQLAGQRAAEAVAILRILQQRTSAGTVWSSEDPSIVTPDLWVGFLGPAVSVALHSGGVGHAVISPQWLRRCARF